MTIQGSRYMLNKKAKEASTSKEEALEPKRKQKKASTSKEEAVEPKRKQKKASTSKEEAVEPVKRVHARNTLPMISKYELAALLSERAHEISNDQPITIQNPGTTNPAEIACLEYKAGKSPKKLKRTWPDGTEELWSLSDLQVVTDY